MTTPPSHPATTLLSRAHSPQTASTLFTNKIKNKPLLLTPSHTSTSTSSRAKRQHIRAQKRAYHTQHARPRPLSAKESRQLNLATIPAHELKYDVYRGLNDLWTGYILEVLGFMANGVVVPDVDKRSVSASQGALVASADFHGMEVEVVRCVDVGRVGVKGIVVRETRGMFVLVKPGDRVVRVLKRGAVFRVVVTLPRGEAGEGREQLKGVSGDANASVEGRKLVFELHGDQLEVRPVERATRKFKWKLMDYL